MIRSLAGLSRRCSTVDEFSGLLISDYIRKFTRGHFGPRYFCSDSTTDSLLPTKPVWKEPKRPSEPVKLDPKYVEHLERLSLVRFSNEAAVRHLEKAISYADQLQEVDTTGVEPMYSVLENETLHLREDVVTEDWGADMMRNAAKTVEDYFVTPPGNIPLDSVPDKIDKKQK